MSGHTKRKVNTRKKSSGSRKKNTKDLSFVKREIIILGVLAFSILLLISNYGLGGQAGHAISSVGFGLFGFMSYVFPIVLFCCFGLYMSNGKSKRAIWKITATIVLFLFLEVFCYLITKGFQVEYTIFDWYQYSSQERSGGGVFGGLIGHLLYQLFGTVGAYVFTIIFLIAALVILTERSFINSLTKGSQKMYDTALSENEKRKERAKVRQAERAEKNEQKQQRMQKKYSGVALDTKLPAKAQKGKMEDIHEVTMDIPEDSFTANEEPELEIDLSVQNFTPEIEPDDSFDHLTEKLEQEYNETREELLTSPQNMVEEVVPTVETEKAKEKSVPKENTGKEEEGKAMDSHEFPTLEREYQFPPIDLLKKGRGHNTSSSEHHIKDTANKLQQTLQNFGVRVKVTNVSCGPSVTRYELQPDQGVKVSKIVSLSDDIKLNLAAADIRIEAPIPGKAAVGIEVPNKSNSVVMFRDLIESKEFKKQGSSIAFAAGKDIGGQVVVTDIAKMPHLLIAGATGSGKSVCINTIIMSILYKANPDDVKLIMIDPKVVELSVYNGIPHLFIPVVTDPKKASGALHWAVAEMTDRYKKFADLNVRDLKGYNKKIAEIKDIEEEDKPQKLPQIVIIVDELADLMMVAPGEVEDAICRLAQLARAAGIHLIIATQRPSVNVITGLIKANMPSRIAFAVSSGVDSRTIIDMNGAEKLLGKGDMLFFPQGYQKPARVQGAFVSDQEVGDVVSFLVEQYKEVQYNTDIEEKMNNVEKAVSSGGSAASDIDVYFVDAGKFIIEKDKASIGMLQRQFKIGFNRAARIMDQLAGVGAVGEEEGTKPRKVLMSMEEFEQLVEEQI